MLNKIFHWFESRIHPYPDTEPKTPEKGLFRFIWSSIEGMRRWILVLAFFSAGIGIMEALLFQFMGKVVDWLSHYSPDALMAEKGVALAGMALMLVLFIVWRFFSS